MCRHEDRDIHHETGQSLIYQIGNLEKVPLFVSLTFQLSYSVAMSGLTHRTAKVCLLFFCQECKKLPAGTRVSRFPERSLPRPRCHHIGVHPGILPATESHQSRDSKQTDGHGGGSPGVFLWAKQLRRCFIFSPNTHPLQARMGVN